MKALIVLAMMPSAAVAGERITVVVCPPALSYCYYDSKPILTEDTAGEELWKLNRQISELEAAREEDDRSGKSRTDMYRRLFWWR